MRSKLLARWRTVGAERGIAMVTVMLVGATLTAVSSAGAFITINEFRATNEDRAGAQSLGFAEAGIDRMMLALRDGSITWNNISSAGCTVGGITYPPLQVSGNVGDGGGSYVATMRVYDPDASSSADRFPPTACSSASTDPQAGPHHFVIESVGSQPAARRVVRQVILIEPIGLPVGIYAYERIYGNGTVNMENISMISEGVMERRDDFAFTGTDPYYTLNHFFANGSTTKIPAAAHSIGQITYGPASKLIEHRSGFEPNCEANPKGTAGQSLWDSSGTAVQGSISSGCTGWTDYPPRSSFTQGDLEAAAPTPTLSEKDYMTLAEAAKAKGLYCKPSATSGKISCIKMGVLQGDVDMTIEGNSPLVTGLPNNFIAFFDFPAAGDPFDGSKTITWKPSVRDCSVNPEQNRSVVLIVRNGSLSSEGGSYNVGAMIIPEGQLTNKGTFTVEGTIIAKRIAVGGTVTFKLTDCWVRNLPGPFLDVFPTTWSEVDR